MTPLTLKPFEGGDPNTASVVDALIFEQALARGDIAFGRAVGFGDRIVAGDDFVFGAQPLSSKIGELEAEIGLEGQQVSAIARRDLRLVSQQRGRSDDRPANRPRGRAEVVA